MEKKAKALLQALQEFHKTILADKDQVYNARKQVTLKELFKLYSVSYVGYAIKVLLDEGIITKSGMSNYFWNRNLPPNLHMCTIAMEKAVALGSKKPIEQSIEQKAHIATEKPINSVNEMIEKFKVEIGEMETLLKAKKDALSALIKLRNIT